MKNVTYINASAGSGKTYTLTHKLAELIAKHKVEPEQVIMTTFTVKAATEMKEEAKKVLYEKSLFEQASRLDQAMIGTIHSVANALINKYWFFLGLSPDMGVMAEEDTQFYISQSLSDLPTHEELQQLHEFFEDFDIQYKYGSGKRGINYDCWKNDIQQIIAFTTNYEITDYERSIKESLDYIKQFVNPDLKSDYRKEELMAILKEHQIFLDSKPNNASNDGRKAELKSLWRGVGHPTVRWYKRLAKLLNALKTCGPLAENMRDQLADFWHFPLIYQKQETYIRLLFTLAARWKDRYTNYKKEKNLLDYNDMEKYLRDLLTNEKLSEEISKDYRYLFVDEYQDCSPIQVKIFDRLSELMERSFWVGDYKQAIYGFRGSDITLTKAVVDHIAMEQNGCKMAKPLDTSYRSLPDIVKVCNKTFKQTFNGVLEESSIVLKEHRENKEGITSLRYWNMTDENAPDIPAHIAQLVQQGVKPNEIAVLGRMNAPLNQIANTLNREYRIPTSREDMPVMEMNSTPLVMALLALVASEKDALAKAQIAFLTEKNFGTKELIEHKLLFDAEEDSHTKDFLNNVPLVQRLLKLRPMLKQQSVAALVETMIVELDLYNEVKKIGYVSESVSCLNTFIRTAYAYEQHCIQMNLPATVNGFMDYLMVVNPVGQGDANGVQLHTYHSSKGLQWKFVILTSLRECINDPKKIVKQNIFGIHFNYTEHPSAVVPYPEVFIRVIPFIYGSGSANIPADILLTIEASPLFQKVKEDTLSESNRLLYVGMTRPKDVMILALEPPAKGNHVLEWFKDVGLNSVNITTQDDLLGIGYNFKKEVLTNEQLANLSLYTTEDEKMKTHRIPYMSENCTEEQKYLSPSSLRKKGFVDKHYDICERMPRGTLVGKTMADVGNCIHQIFCGIEQHIDNEDYYKDLIASYGLTTYLKDISAIKKAWKALVSWLKGQFGEVVHIYHERPFTHLKDGQVFTGSIDLVWQTAEGDILIDFKTCPLGHKYILDKESEHYAGWYAGQLDAYTDALEAAGEKVIKRFIYYPVSGMLCEISRGMDWKPPYMENTFHVFGIDGLVMNDLWDEAVNYCSDNGFSGEIKIFEQDTKEEGLEVFNTVLCGASTQGIYVTYIHQKDTHLHIELPWLGSVGDVKLAFAYMKALKKIYPDCAIFMDDNSEGQFAVTDDNYDAMVVRRLINMRSMVEASVADQHLGAPGWSHDFIVPSTNDYPDMDIEDVVLKAANMFVELQWAYTNYSIASKANITTPAGEEYIARFLTNNEDTFVGVCQHILLMDNSEVKDVPIQDFFKAIEGNPHFKMVDAGQFIMRKMQDDEWQKLYDTIDIKPIRSPKTYLLRWNPAISSFKLDDYRKATTECPDGFGFDWSIYEWDDAHENDRYYMLRTGDENAGIVWRGIFTSEPYEDEDWARQGKRRYYMEMDCYDCIPANQKPPIDIELLEKEIPEINWRKGYSGQLLTKEITDKLNKLWDNNID